MNWIQHDYHLILQPILGELIMFFTHVNKIFLESFPQIVDEGEFTAKILQQNEVLNTDSVAFV